MKDFCQKLAIGTALVLPVAGSSKTDKAPSTAPGQANDHSGPAFVGGGKPDPHK